MERYMCHICGWNSVDERKVKEHMESEHSVKVEEEPTDETYCCVICKYEKKGMLDFRNHMRKAHNKDAWNWGLEINVKFKCDQCVINFPNKTNLRRHIEDGHQDDNIVVEDSVRKIKPDMEFLTQNTKDLNEMLKNLPKEAFYGEEEDFQKDFDEILNEKPVEKEDARKTSLKCVECNFKGSSKRVLRVHNKFVHDLEFHSCTICASKTRSVGAMRTHMWGVHKIIAKYKNSDRPSEIVIESSEASETDDSDEADDDEFNNLPDPYAVKDWKSGINFKARTPGFEKGIKWFKILAK